MSHLTPIPEELYVRVVTLAAQQGITPEQVIEQATETYLQAHPVEAAEDIPGYDPADDPLAEFAGKFGLISPDSIARHDFYLGGEAMNPHDTEK